MLWIPDPNDVNVILSSLWGQNWLQHVNASCSCPPLPLIKDLKFQWYKLYWEQVNCCKCCKYTNFLRCTTVIHEMLFLVRFLCMLADPFSLLLWRCVCTCNTTGCQPLNKTKCTICRSCTAVETITIWIVWEKLMGEQNSLPHVSNTNRLMFLYLLLLSF